jgi:class 3 adenylate cyclase/pimeloyl-ACP methyl ester carboxylesterase
MGAGGHRGLRAIVFTDIVGYTALVARDEARAASLLDRARRLVRELAAQFGGECLEAPGDETLSRFPSSVEAARCALAIQAVLAGDPELALRIGIHVGDVLEREDGLVGDGVNVAARLRPLAAAGGVCISERVWEDLRGHAEFGTRPIGEVRLRNVERPVRAHALFRRSEGHEAAAPRWPRARVRLVVALALAGVGMTALYLARYPLVAAAARRGWLRPGPTYSQEIAFVETSDGVRLAYGVAGAGPAIVLTHPWFTHIERGMFSPGWNPYLPPLLGRHRGVVYDGRGSGLSDRNVAEHSLEARVRDLEAVVDAAGLERFGLYAISAGAAPAIAYAARHPERVTRIAFYGAFARIDGVPGERERWTALVPIVRIGWGSDSPVFRQLFTNLFMPSADEGAIRVFTEMQRVAASGSDAARFIEGMLETDVTQLARGLSLPALVVHVRGDAIVPFELGREIAALIPGARLVALEGDSHAPVTHEHVERLGALMSEFFAADLPAESAFGRR